VTIGLRKVAQHAPCQRIELLGEQTYVIAACDQALEQAPGFLIPTLQYVIVEAIEVAIETTFADFGVNFVGDLAPASP
jgi:hypothetical protein